MQLADFITAVLIDVEKGVNTAALQTNRITYLKSYGGIGDDGVEFDVAVTATSELAGKVGAEVLSIGAKTEGKLKNEEVSRIKFKINVGNYFPKK